MIYYKIKGKTVLSKIPRDNYEVISEEEAKNDKGIIYSVTNINPRKSRKYFCVSHPSLLFLEKEGLELLKSPKEKEEKLPEWLIEKINKREVCCVNATYPYWEDVLKISCPNRWRINIIGLGDVGGNVAAGLRLAASNYVSSIGIYDIDESKAKRWFYEIGQIVSPSLEEVQPEVHILEESNIFDCDMFVFCVSNTVPEVGKEPEDVRIAQFEDNARILSYYSKLAREKNYSGLFIVMSDPVDLLCNIAFMSSNKDKEGIMDFRGLSAEQIRGYGLGVMHGRAAFFAKEAKAYEYMKEGRCFGPHGKGVVAANSIENYDEKLSDYLTLKTQNGNLDVRSFGFKPYIAPAFSSGVLSFIETIKGNFHYSATFMGGVFMGSKNRLLPSGTELETYDFPPALYKKLESTYNYLEDMYELPIFKDTK